MSIVERIRARPHDAPMPTEHLLDEAADLIEQLTEALDQMVIWMPSGFAPQSQSRAMELAYAALAAAKR